jgi:hypothetical protein
MPTNWPPPEPRPISVLDLALRIKALDEKTGAA